jgi:hypothetical protein
MWRFCAMHGVEPRRQHSIVICRPRGALVVARHDEDSLCIGNANAYAVDIDGFSIDAKFT